MTGYELVRSRRKTLSVQVTREGRVIVRAPLRLAKREIDRFVREHADWIAKALAHQRSLAEAHPEPDEQQARALVERAAREIPRRPVCRKKVRRNTGIFRRGEKSVHNFVAFYFHFRYCLFKTERYLNNRKVAEAVSRSLSTP